MQTWATALSDVAMTWPTTVGSAEKASSLCTITAQAALQTGTLCGVSGHIPVHFRSEPGHHHCCADGMTNGLFARLALPLFLCGRSCWSRSPCNWCPRPRLPRSGIPDIQPQTTSRCLLAARLFVLSSLLLASPKDVAAQYTLEIANVFSSIEATVSGTLQPGEVLVLPKGTLFEPTEQAYVCIVKTSGRSPLRLLVFDEATDPLKLPLAYLLDRDVTPSDTVALPRSRLGMGVMLENRSANTVEVSATVFKLGLIDTDAAAGIRTSLAAPLQMLADDYVLPPFTVALRGCGNSNAYSQGPRIVICTELIGDLTKRNLLDALLPIIFHEVGHTLLNLWGLPGYDNEDVADEFAVVRAFKNPRPLVPSRSGFVSKTQLVKLWTS